jgi:hypothetical protein
MNARVSSNLSGDGLDERPPGAGGVALVDVGLGSLIFSIAVLCWYQMIKSILAATETHEDIKSELAELSRQADKRGVSLKSYLPSLAQSGSEPVVDYATPEKIDQALALVSAGGALPQLPEDFSRRDIYDDHDWCVILSILASCFVSLIPPTSITMILSKQFADWAVAGKSLLSRLRTWRNSGTFALDRCPQGAAMV